ncbi:Eco57I restriction-modification methylase [Rubripirellula obstinata]|uniref:site-specific DNA-methyltransferase (adenine-specific) n=1 Tax=Rubripirellula obstinata TaxID=406547 RepID=A0A5B1CD96_9BACT|nr:hypothetical protein [Rubripirellula obstinata]KAA1258182.1 Eco57I restriction-modification methylase [Rubripirellula obstinata]
MPTTNHQPPTTTIDWWNALRHGGMLVDPTRLTKLISDPPPPLSSFETDRLRRRIVSFEQDENAGRGKFVSYVLDSICGFARAGTWDRGTSVDPARWTRRTIAGDDVKPNHLWRGPSEAILPVFIDAEKRVGVGRGKRAVTAAIQWLRGGDEKLAVVTNGRQWRLVMAGLDYEAFCEWDIDRWLESGQTSAELFGLRALLNPPIWTPSSSDESSPLVEAIADSRKGQADLSAVLGERVRQAVEILIQAHGPVLGDWGLVAREEGASGLGLVNGKPHSSTTSHQPPAPSNQEIYRAGVRLVMRLVVGLFAESREGLLPKDNPIFHECYSLSGLRDQLERVSPSRRAGSYSAYPRVVSLFRLIHDGSSHEALAVPSYGGSLFAPGQADSSDGVSRALHVLEQGCYEHEVISDAKVYSILDLLSRTKVKIRQGRGGTWVPSPVDFSSLDSEYIGILYEGLLDFELRVAGDDGPVIFLAVGNQPALPLSTLEAMDDKSLKNLLEKMKDTSSGDDEEEASDEDEDDTPPAQREGSSDSEGEGEPEDDEDDETSDDTEEESADDIRHTARTAAEAWAKRAIEVGKLVRKPRGAMTPEKQLGHQAAIDRKAKQIITKVVLPGERYLVRWGGTRKGSGTFYTRPQLAIPTVHRTLRPLVVVGDLCLVAGENQSLTTIPQSPTTIPRLPEEILSLKVCDPACGSGSFPLAALRFLTDALYHSLVYHKRFKDYADHTVIELIHPPIDSQSQATNHQPLATESLPCRPDDAEFEPRTKAVLRRYIVERCIYGVDLDPLAVELCRLSLWIETLDRRLPFTFLDHKIKCGNSLVGTWFDQFMHYPAMAWMREGGDKNHSNGVHFEKDGWGKAIKAGVGDVKNELKDYIDGAQELYTGVDLVDVQTVHDDAERALQEIHALGIHQVEARAQQYRELLESDAYRAAKFSLDQWCATWFWPPEQIDQCPGVLNFYDGKMSEPARQIVIETADRLRFFHWQLEFPDVFASDGGFDCVIGNPPWDIAKPNSKEFFSALDPLYRSYGKQAANKVQENLFEADADVERNWLLYNADFRALSNWLKGSGYAFGNRVNTANDGKQTHDINLGDRGRDSFASSQRRHDKWKENREALSGYSMQLEDDRGYRHQGGGDINLYKMFLEQSHALLHSGGRLGMIVPSGIYSDHGTRNLRELFLDRCQWEWLFGFENREGIFDIHRSFKFNPLIITKGGRTESIKTAFMRRDIEDWESGERYATKYPRERVIQFSPRSKAILEIQSRRDLEVLEKIYSGSVLLGDDGPDGWGITYSREFDMTNDSKLFPPRTWWEERGYIPDEYSRWIKGKWQSRTSTSPAPPNCPRTQIPAGIFLSRDGEQFIHEEDIDVEEFTQANGKPIIFKIENEDGETEEVQPVGPAIAMPLYEGRMIGIADFSEKGWISGKGRTAVWEPTSPADKTISPQYLMGKTVQSLSGKAPDGPKISYMRISSTTNSRTMIATYLRDTPACDSVFFYVPKKMSSETALCVSSIIGTFAYDFIVRKKVGGLNLSDFVISETPLPKPSKNEKLRLCLLSVAAQLLIPNRVFASDLVRIVPKLETPRLAATPHERMRLRCILEAIAGAAFQLTSDDFRWIFKDCDFAVGQMPSNRDPKGFWRIAKDNRPEIRSTVLSQIAFNDLKNLIETSGSESAGVADFLTQNDGEGWQLPETLRLSDYGLGHDQRAKQAQPVRECFGPRFYDWQLAQTPEESWAECHLHARNLLGEPAYRRLVDGDSGSMVGEESADYQTHTTSNQPPATNNQPPEEPFRLTGEPKPSKRRR